MTRPIKVYASKFGRSMVGYGWTCNVPGCGQLQFPYWSAPDEAANAALRHLRSRHADAIAITHAARAVAR